MTTAVRKVVLMPIMLCQVLGLEPLVLTSTDTSRRKAHNQSQVIRRKQPQWQAATFRRLVVGKSKLEDALRIFGPPQWSGPEADRDNSDPDPPFVYEYESGGEFPGKLSIIVGERSKIIFEIANYPKNLFEGSAIRHFGPDYIISRYDFCPDVYNTVAPIYESPDGEIKYIKYHKRGIVLLVDDFGSVEAVLYVRTFKTLSSKSECPKAVLKEP
jgi:hypothetical protein